MKANELRVGNWLNDAKPFQVDASDILAISRMTLLCTEEKVKKERLESLYKPIRLTPEILEKCGFKIGGYDLLFWNKGKFELAGLNWADEGIEEYKFVNFRWHKGKDGIISIYYLHQLQNLYFALTGEELQINL